MPLLLLFVKWYIQYDFHAFRNLRTRNSTQYFKNAVGSTEQNLSSWEKISKGVKRWINVQFVIKKWIQIGVMFVQNAKRKNLFSIK